MEQATLGQSAISVSRIGFGCMSLGEEYDINEHIIHRALELGINYFDTADLYQQGLNETTLGKALQGKRGQAVIATKVGNQLRPDGSGWDWNPGKAYILQAVDKSLQRLQTDYIDLYQLHGGTMDDPIDETIEAFELLKQQGKIREYGISSIRPNVIRAYVERSNIVSVMLQYSLLDRRPEEETLDLLKDNHISVLVRGSLAKGLLVNKAPAAYLDHTADEVARAAKAVRSLAVEDRTAAQTAVQYVLSHPAVTAAVAGMRTLGQLEEIVDEHNIPLLTLAERELLDEAIEPNVYEAHR